MTETREIEDMDDFEAASRQRPLVVDFTGSYCAPCRQLAPLLARLAERYRGRVEVITVDITERPDLSERYGVRAVPTLVAFAGGRMVAQQIGFGNPRRVEELFAGLAKQPEHSEPAALR